MSQYTGRNIIAGYRRHFKVSAITAVNDLQAIGVGLDATQVANIKINRHYSGEQQICKKELNSLRQVVSDEFEEY